MKNFKDKKSLEELRENVRIFKEGFDDLSSSCDVCLQMLDELVLARNPKKIKRLRMFIHGFLQRLTLGEDSDDFWGGYTNRLNSLASTLYNALQSNDSERAAYSGNDEEEREDDDE